MPADLAVIILTRDEEAHIGRAIASVSPIAGAVYVVDSGSRDRTIEIAEQCGARVLHHAWKNYADQFEWAVGQVSDDFGWILRLDADEFIDPDLAATIERELPHLPPDVTGINLLRRHVFMGRWIRYGGRYPLVLLRIFRRGHGRIEQRWMDEHIVLESGRALTFEGGFWDDNLKGVGFFMDKHNSYATREALDVLSDRHGLGLTDAGEAAAGSQQMALKRWIKTRIFNRLPMDLAAILYFLHRYVLQLGFLDGPEGVRYHVLQGLSYRVLVGAKVTELESAMAGCSTVAERRAALERATGLRLG